MGVFNLEAIPGHKEVRGLKENSATVRFAVGRR
jgi:hypothetical protein